MSADNKMKSTKNNKKNDGKFRSKHVNHSPESESSRAQFGMRSSQRSEKDEE